MPRASSKVLRVYWPSDILSILCKNSYPPSVVIGWRNDDNDLVVVTTLPFLDLALVDSLLSKDVLLSDYHLPPKQIYSICGVEMLSVLGTVNCAAVSPENKNNVSQFKPHKTFFNVAYSKDLKYPVIDHPAPGHPLFTPDHSFPYSNVQIIMFDPPLSHRLQYFAHHPPSLELPEKTSFTVISEQLEKTLVDQEHEAQELYEKVKFHAEYDQENLDQHLRVLNNCIAQLNTCRDLALALRKRAASLFPRLERAIVAAANQNRSTSAKTKIMRRLSVSEYAVVSAKHVQGRIASAVMPVLLRAAIYIVLFFRFLAEVLLRTIEWRPGPSWYALKELSATAQQIDLRLQQFCYWPVQYLRIRRQSQDWTCNYASFNVEYVLFYNNIWLIINDVIIGITLSKLILEFRDVGCEKVSHAIDNLLTQDFERTILWLMDWPGGLKLNNELATFFGGLFIWVVQFWRIVLDSLRPCFPAMILIVAYSGFAGATLLLSVVSDLVSFATVHVYAFYLASGKIYHWQLTVLRSLFHLFRGKKRNILRNRVDSCSYELDQLLMGTIFFTSLIFLLPTVLVFYLTFAACRFSIILVNALLESCLAYLNHFPLFAIMLYFKDYKRLPGGISFVLITNTNHAGSRSTILTNYVALKPLPLPFSTIFFQYRLLYSRIRFWYLSFPVIIRLLSGQFVPIQRSQLYALLYSKLPKERVSTSQLYNELMAEFFQT